MEPRATERPTLEVWGGIECTINRVGDTYFEQLVRTGHIDRPNDLDMIAGLGIKALRYPVLWEHVASTGLENADWAWHDQQLNRLRELNVRPIVGLVHHGSGPRDTSLTDPAFPERLADFAEAVARRYPWLDSYTPVNEPLTTARFSTLYGHWYPHNRDDQSFVRAMVGQARAVALSMQRIRQVNPAAQLIQTDDLGRVYSSPALKYQADFENERRWLTFDLLTGTLTRDRQMWHWLRWKGISQEELEWFEANPCPPDVIGLNTYLSSERFIDERIDRYPGETPGTNGRHTYVDVLAARVLPEGIMGSRGLLGEAWARYQRPLAITEVHNGGEREEQIRWLQEVWEGAHGARQDGADVRAVTVWALLGLYDWPSLVTRQDNVYEPGVFDVRGSTPRPTAIARMVSDLARHGHHHHPVLAVPGWWRRPERFWYDTSSLWAGQDGQAAIAPSLDTDVQQLLVYGVSGELREALEEALSRRAIPYTVVDDKDVYSARVERRSLVDAARAWAVIDTSYVDLERMREAGEDSEALAIQREALVAACAERHIPLLSFSYGHETGRRDDSAPAHTVLPVPRTIDAGLDIPCIDHLNAHPRSITIRIESPAHRAVSVGPDEGPSMEERSDILPLPIAGNLPFASWKELADVSVDLLIDGGEGVWQLRNPPTVSESGIDHWIADEDESNRPPLTISAVSQPAATSANVPVAPNSRSPTRTRARA